jgi:hypothetical protein
MRNFLYSSCEVPKGGFEKLGSTMPATTTATSKKNVTGTSQQAYESLLNGYFEDRDMKISDGQLTP